MKSGNWDNCEPGEVKNKKLRTEIKKILNQDQCADTQHIYTEEEVIIIEDFFKAFSEILLNLNSNQNE